MSLDEALAALVAEALERFTGILLEHYAGHLPLWLAPLQIGRFARSPRTATTTRWRS